MSSLTVEEDQKWLPTHVQVTVLRGRGLRGKGKHGTSDVYTIIQLAKEKYSTGVAEKTTEPEWREECSFELQPGVLQGGGRSGGGGYPAGSNELVLIVMHRAMMGLDVFLGQAVIQLDKVFQETRCVKNEWYKLNSKTGKKEKERGDIQATVQFTRNNLTASMYDLVMKDKSASTFGKLKERIKGKKRSSEEDAASAVLPSGYGSLHRMRQRLPSDGGGEEDYEDDEGGEARRSKMRTFFLRGKLRKSSDTRSSTSLGSESSESSRGGSLSPTAGISVVVSDLSNSPSNSSNLTADNSPEHTANSLQCEFGDEVEEITIAVPQPTVCVNGSHAYSVQPLDPGSGNPADCLSLAALQKSLPHSVSLQNLSPSTNLPKGSVGDGRRWSFDKPGEEEKAAIAAALEQSGPMQGDEEEEEEVGSAAPPKSASSSSSTVESESQGKKQRRNLFSHGKRESAGKGQSKDESEQASAATEEKHKGWFGSKDSNSKPSLVVSPKLEPSTDPHPPSHPPGPPVDPASLVSPLHHTNPFYPSQSPPPPMSPCNPFFSVLQHNPFYDDTLTAQTLKPSPPPLPYLSSARPPIAQLFPQASNPNPPLTTEDSIMGTKSEVTAKAEKRPLPPAPAEEEKPLSVKLSDCFMTAGELDPEWDESFEAFAAGRLQSPEDLTTDCKTQQNTASEHTLEHCDDKGALLPITDANTNVNDALHPQPCTEFEFDAHKATNTYHLDTFAQFLETIPEHASVESDNTTLNTSTNSPKPAAFTETNQANDATNAKDLTEPNVHHAPGRTSSVKLNSSSPDPASSGLGSSADEDFPSCLSSYSDKFSASSSSEEAEAQNCEGSILCDEKASDRSVEEKPSQSEDDRTDGSIDLSLGFSKVLNDSSASVSNTTDVMTSTTPDDELCSTHPSLYIITSSPDVRQTSSDSSIQSLARQDASPSSSVPFRLFGDFFNTSQDFDDTLLNTRVFDQSTSSFFQSLYVSTSSQDYQTCASHPSSGGSEPNDTLHSVNLTLCGELSEIQVTDAQEDPIDTSKPCDEDIRHVDGAFCGAEDKTATLEPSFTIGENLGFLPATSTDSNMSGDPQKLNKGDVESQHVVLGDVFSKCPDAQTATLHRSHSEGTLTPAFDELLMPSFGSDPGAMQASSSAPPGPDLPSLISFAPSLTPQSSSFPLALSSPPFLDYATARSPTARAAAPKPMLQETWQQQAANQQNSPHPVKPLTTATLTEEKRTEGRSVLATGLEKLKSTIHPGRSSQLSEQETDRKKSVSEGAGSYYHLNHSELVALLVQREAELARQETEFKRQKFLLAKREVELKKLKPQVKDLEDYIDTLLVRIMEQKPTLLQVRSKLK
ncbi:rab11 family-interacting protein 1 [Cottoperca gobio]|uniref:Rab11 family-interacting protein 1 n=1 Tax=Cottoperca gobio TaxID=56716 RepID=A0A6J2S2F6_COTGO|nr:rab11 family-interacting protein 1-like [Cottoperca gobio]